MAANGDSRRVVPVAWAGFLLIGWSGVLLPSLVRQVEARFGVADAALGIAYLAASLGYASASFGGGVLTERVGRRAILVIAACLIATGLTLEAAAPSWPLFVLGAPMVGLGSGAIDGGMNALLLAIVQAGRGRALNLLHLFFSIGAFVSPLVVGRLVSAGVEWPLVLFATAVAAVPLGVALSLVPMPSGRRDARLTSPATEHAHLGSPPTAGRRLPLALLGIAIACYVASEIGVSNWLVRFLAGASLDTATLALSGFWAGLALGRIVSARIADRLPHTAFTATAGFAAGFAILLAVASPSIELSIAAFALAGFAFGPVFPMIIAIGGDLYPDRLATTAGTLTAVSVIGAIVYPPLVGLLSASLGIGTGMLGAAGLSAVSAVAILLAGRSRRS
jgi:fucose permease